MLCAPSNGSRDRPAGCIYNCFQWLYRAEGDKSINGVNDTIISNIETRKSTIFNFLRRWPEKFNEYKESNPKIQEEKALLTKYQGNFYEIALGWDVRPKSYDERFGWRRFDTDGCLTIDDTLVIIEVKISKPGTEYGYWNAFSQGLIYSFQQKQDEPGKDFLVLCIILDWGRAAKRKLNECEKEILDLFRPHRIYFLRVSMADKPFIEHNLNTDWSVIA